MLGKAFITANAVSSSKAALKVLEDAGCEVQFGTAPAPFDEQWFIEHGRDADAWVFTMEPIGARIVDAAPKLKVIARPGVGYDTVDVAACTRRRIPVTIAAGTNDQSVADFAMGLLLTAARGIVEAAQITQQRKWDRIIGTEVWSKTLTIVGLGRIGKNMVRRARGFDMRVLIVTRTPDRGFATLHEAQYVDLETGLREADFVSLHAPLTPETGNLINARTIALMKPGAFLINTSRGGLVDEAALADAVRSKRLGGAAVDVLRQQGPNTPSILLGVPGIIVTPHMATFAREAIERVAVSVANSVVAVLRGERPAQVVNPEIYQD